MTNFQKLIATFKQNQKYQIAVFIALLFLGWFYWFQIRPSQIKASCQIEADDYFQKAFDRKDTDKDGLIFRDDIDWLTKRSQSKYQTCLHQNGL